MEDLQEYSQYKQLISIYLDGDGSMHILQSSNRAICVQKIKEISGYSAVSESMNLVVKDLFPKYFELQSRTQLSERELLLQLTIVNYFKDIKQTVLSKSENLLHTVQLVFVMPIEWEGETYQNDIRTLFLEAEWIKPRDGKHKLIFAPFLEVLIDYLQKGVYGKRFIREGKYVLCYVRSGHKDNEILFNSICFQMQSAKEMIAISKTLASSNFLLVPTIKSSRTMNVSNTDQIVCNIVEQLLIESKTSATQNVVEIRRKSGLSFLKRSFKIHLHASEEDTLKKLTHATMGELSSIYKTYSHNGADQPWCRDADNSKLRKRRFREYLSTLTCGRLITEIWDDAIVKQFIEQAGDIITSMLDQYGTAGDLPDGIQDVILYKCNPRIKNASCNIIEDALTERILEYVDILQHENYFLDTPGIHEICESAMLRPFKMIQIANAVLSPIIVDQQDTDDALSSLNTTNNDIIAPNAYYAQVRISKQCVDFILNKAVAVSSSDNAIQTFTALEKRIEIHNIMETALDNMWNHYQSLDPDVLQASILKSCSQKHGKLELSLRNYGTFKSSLMKMIKIWFSDTSPVVKEKPDSYHLVSIDETCDCALKISHRMLLEAGLRPAIKNMASMIVGTLVSNDSFGLYYVPTIIIITGRIIENLFFSFHTEQCLKESIQNRFYVHQRKPTLHFYNDKEANCQLIHYLGRGSYSQLSSTSYIIEFYHNNNSDGDFLVGVQEEDVDFSTSLKIERWKSKSSYHFFNCRFSAKHSLLRRGDVLNPEGTSKTITIGFSCTVKIAIFALDTTLKTQTWRRIWSEGLSWPNYVSYPITITVAPLNHTSTVQIGFSYLSDIYINKLVGYRLVEIKRSVDIHERLHLKALS